MMSKTDDLDVIALAHEIFPQISGIAISLCVPRSSQILGAVAAGLSIAAKYLDIYSIKQDQTFREELEKVLVLLSCLCTPYALSKKQYPPLRGLKDTAKELETSPSARERIRQRLIGYDEDHITARKKQNDVAEQKDLLTKLHEALKTVNESFQAVENAPRKKLRRNPNDYPTPINSRLYKILEKHSKCYCPRASEAEHFARLCLRSEILMHGEDILFDMLFSGNRTCPRGTFSHWQQIRLLLPSKETHPKGRLTFADENDPLQKLSAGDNVTNVKIEEFCKLLNKYHGPIWICIKVKNEKLFRLSQLHESEELFEPCESISLADTLLKYHVTAKMKLVLAYILAHSVWRYYNSDWMKARWSTDSIHFLKEQALDQVPGISSTRIYACNPCFAVQFRLSENDVMEFYDGVVMHKYPRLLALGNLLVDIGRQQPLLRSASFTLDNLDQQINYDCTKCQKTLKHDANWPYFGTLDNPSVRMRYKEITETCFKKDLFLADQSAASKRNKGHKEVQMEQEVEERRAILYHQIVAPLEELLEDLGWKEALKQIEPMKDCSPETSQSMSIHLSEARKSEKSISRTEFLGSSSFTSGSDAWLRKVQNVYRQVLWQYMKQIKNPSYKRIRIAVLDTGYDPKAEFFVDRDRNERLRGWKDWVTDSAWPRDDEGHGSRVLSLIMKVAPMADVYVARVAKNSNELERSVKSIAEAIAWATDGCGADIVTMSFGFAEEEIVDEQSPLRQAIHQAVLDRSDKILFFAAAGNDGANLTQVMFPARHELVIPVYGTDAKGTFLDALNPRIKRDGPAIFGTLAQDAPCAGLSGENEVHATGTSFATAIAAGLAAMLLEYVQLLESSKQGSHERQLQWKARLSTRRGMLAIFSNIAENPPDRRYYLHPIHFFQKGEDVREASIINAVDLSR